MPSQESPSVAIWPVISEAKLGVVFSALVLIIFLASANLAHGRSSKAAHGAVEEQPFGTTKEGKKITLYTLTNSHHMEVRAMNYGAIIVSLRVPDRKGQVADVVLGHDTLEGYFDNSPHLGGLVGRYANRIANGSFTLDGVKYSLPKNNGPNTLHGGIKGFDQAVWQGTPLKGKTGVAFSYLSKDGEEGFPGNLKVRVSYSLKRHSSGLHDSDEGWRAHRRQLRAAGFRQRLRPQFCDQWQSRGLGVSRASV